ncbi:MAG: type II secretion system F family protein [Acidimicrobiales bacterium]
MGHRTRALLAPLVVLLGIGAMLLASGTASAQATSALSVRSVDARNPEAVQVTFTYVGDRRDLTGLAVREGDVLVRAQAAVPLADQRALGIALVIDASTSMKTDGLIDRVLDAAHAFVDGKAASDQIAVVAFNKTATVLQDFTTNSNLLDGAIDRITTGPDTAVYDGIVSAAELFTDSSLQPNIVLFSDGGDTASRFTASRAQSAVTNVGGALFAIGVENSGFTVLETLAAATGGSSAIASDPAGVGELFDTVQVALARQYVVTFASSVSGGNVPLTISVGDQQATSTFRIGSNETSTVTAPPEVVPGPSGPALFRNSSGLWLGLILVLVAVGVMVVSLGNTFLGGENTLNRALRPYGEDYVAADAGEAEGDGRPQQFAQTPILQRAVAATGQFAERQGFLTKIEGQLERANLPLRPAEAIFFYFAGVVVFGLLLVALTRNGFGALIGTILAALIPPALLSYLATRRQKQFDSLLPDTLQLLASTLRAGYSLMQGIEAVSQEVSEPVGRELRRVVTEARLGRPLEESLDGIATRMDSADFGWAVMAIRIQREVGGNLAELLVTVADTMTERERLRRDVNALVAEGKISAIVLTILPVGLGGFIYSVNPDYMEPLFEETVGKALLGGALVLMLFGFWWMKKTIEIDI